jgi:hypothetical protein
VPSGVLVNGRSGIFYTISLDVVADGFPVRGIDAAWAFGSTIQFRGFLTLLSRGRTSGLT